jgi:hypothetical protein
MMSSGPTSECDDLQQQLATAASAFTRLKVLPARLAHSALMIERLNENELRVVCSH